MASSIVGCNISAYCRPRSLIWRPINNPVILSNYKDQSYFQSNNFGLRWNNTTKRNFVVYAGNAPPDSNVPSDAPLMSSEPSSNSLVNQILRMMTPIMPFLSSKFGPFWILKNKIESEVEKVELIVNAVEKVAEQVDKVAEDITDNIPQGKLKTFLDAIEDMAERTAETADSIGDFIDKVQEADDQVESFLDSLDGEAGESPKNANAQKSNYGI